MRNLAVVEDAEASFCPGLNVITGETGSGKSVLKGALELALGARADASAVREGAAEARVEAEFNLSGAALSAVAEVLEEADLPPCENGTLSIRRTVCASGGGRIRVNDASATGRTLRRIGSLVADLHGPEDSRAMADGSVQRRLLDSYAGADLSACAAAWSALSSARKALDSLKNGVADFAAEAESLRWAVDEIDAASLTEDDEEPLSARHAAAAHAAEIVEDASAAAEALDGDGGSSAAAALLEAENRLAAAARHFPEAAEWREAAASAVAQIQELARTVTDAVSRIDADPESLAALDERVSLVKRLKRKYAPTVAEILELRDAKAARLDDIEHRAERLEALEKEVAEAEKRVRAEGAALSAIRRKAAKNLAAAVTAGLHGLGFLKSGFSVSVEPGEPSSCGCDEIRFMFAPNPGEPARPLGEIASSGEIARVMLAAESVLAEHGSVPTLFFDEMDSNIGGETGRAVGERLRETAKHRQVIAITHLPQSAVFGDRHLAVSKSVSGGRTRARIDLLEGDALVKEIARMLGDSAEGSAAAAHARELIASAGANRK